jgi:hypothetical protein
MTFRRQLKKWAKFRDENLTSIRDTGVIFPERSLRRPLQLPEEPATRKPLRRELRRDWREMGHGRPVWRDYLVGARP